MRQAGAFRRRPVGLLLRPGTVREARKEAGLTLLALARSDISKTALSQIERGKIRPTAETLKLIAQRTGKPLDYFLEPGQEAHFASASEHELRLQVDELEQLILSSQWSAAADLYDALRQVPMDDGTRAWIDVLGGQALSLTERSGIAEPILRDAAAHFKRAGDKLRQAEALERLALAQQVLEDPACLQTAQDALSICRSVEPRPVGLEVRLLNRVGSIYDGQNRWEDAIKAYELAASRSDEISDLSKLARSLSGLSIAYRALGDLLEAQRYAQRAISIHEMFRDSLALASAENNLGLVLAQLGRTSEARAHLERSLAICDERGIIQGKAHVLLSLAELDSKEGDAGQAIHHASLALEVAVDRGESATIAAAHETLAQALGASGANADEVNRHFDEALRILERLGVTARLGACHAKYAQLLESRGDAEGAAREWKAAASVAHPELDQARGRIDLIANAGA